MDDGGDDVHDGLEEVADCRYECHGGVWMMWDGECGDWSGAKKQGIERDGCSSGVMRGTCSKE